jgi:CBS domain-containing protein
VRADHVPVRSCIHLTMSENADATRSLPHSKRITRLPVLDADQRLVGIISRTDIVRVLAAHPDSMLPV